MSKHRISQLKIIVGLSATVVFSVSFWLGQATQLKPEVTAIDAVALNEVVSGARAPASELKIENVCEFGCESASPHETAFAYQRKVVAKLQTAAKKSESKKFIDLDLSATVFMDWMDATHAKISFRLKDKTESTTPFEVTFKSGLKIESIQVGESATAIKLDRAQDEVNLLKDFVAAYAFESTQDTTGEYTAKWLRKVNSFQKSKLSYIDASLSPKITHSSHVLTLKAGSKSVQAIEGSEATELGTGKTAQVHTQSSYKIARLSVVPSHTALQMTSQLNSENLAIRKTMHSSPALSWAELLAELNQVKKMNSSQRLALFHELVKAGKADPGELAKFKSWLDEHQSEPGVLNLGIGTLASIGTVESQKALLEYFKTTPAAQHTILNAFSTAEAKLSPEAKEFVRGLTENKATPDLAYHAAFALGAALKNEAGAGETSSDEQRLTKLFQTASTAEEKRVYLDAIGNSGIAGFKPVIEQTLSSADESLREKAVFAARFMSVADAQPLIEKGMQDSSLSVRQAAIRAVAFQSSVKPYEPVLKKCALSASAEGKACQDILNSVNS